MSSTAARACTFQLDALSFCLGDGEGFIHPFGCLDDTCGSSLTKNWYGDGDSPSFPCSRTPFKVVGGGCLECASSRFKLLGASLVNSAEAGETDRFWTRRFLQLTSAVLLWKIFVKFSESAIPTFLHPPGKLVSVVEDFTLCSGGLNGEKDSAVQFEKCSLPLESFFSSQFVIPCCVSDFRSWCVLSFRLKNIYD